MRLSFYPGCSLEGMANNYGRSITHAFSDLDIELVEIEDWSCCGATAAHSLSEAMAVALPARNLAAADSMGLDLVTPCAMCFNRLRFSQQALEREIYDVPWQVSGGLRVHDMTRYMASEAMLHRIAERVERPLGDLRVICYYGCQMVRPPKITGYTDFENPRTMDRIMQALGARVRDWSYKSTCCGASIGIGRRDIRDSLSHRILDKARQTGTDAIVVSCPLCQANLDTVQEGSSRRPLPVFYFTELMQLAFRKPAGDDWFGTHITDPRPLLHAKGLI